MDDFEARMSGEAGLQGFDQRAIDFNGHDALGVVEQLLGECAAARPDLDNEFGRFGAHRKSDAFEDRRAIEKMLSESLRHLCR